MIHSSITEMERRLKLSFRRHPLVALGLALSFVVAAAAPAQASASSERNVPAGTQSWLPSDYRGKIVYTGSDSYGRHYDATWDVSWKCDEYGYGDRNQYGLVSPGSFRGIEFQVDLPANTATNYFLSGTTGHYAETTGFAGDEGFYVDTSFEDETVKHLGWGMYNSQNIDGCDSGASHWYHVVVHLVGPATPAAAQTLVWRVSHMYEEGANFGCAPGMAFCMFGDYQYTAFKTFWRGTGVDENSVNYATPGFLVASPFWAETQKMLQNNASDAVLDWAYHIPSHGMNCRADLYVWCYNSGWYSGGDLAYLNPGPPGDKVSTYPAMKFGDVEGDNTVSFTYDVIAPGADWTSAANKKAIFTAEADLICLTPKTGSTCHVLLGAEGVADSDPVEQALVSYDIPNDGYWYTCRVDEEHGALQIGDPSNSFVNGHDRYALVIATADRWVGFDNGFLGNKMKKATNKFPGSDMYNTNACQRTAP